MHGSLDEGKGGMELMNIITRSLQLCNLKDRMKEVLNAVQIIEKKMDAVKVTKSKVRMEKFTVCYWIDKIIHFSDKAWNAAYCGEAVW